MPPDGVVIAGGRRDFVGVNGSRFYSFENAENGEKEVIMNFEEGRTFRNDMKG